ncbi:hypothetical protein B0T14DRAFT_514279 [Immersiella caudata]|uniref:Heterokaryon incompatibility domain-containing protein n=1 Tax=Immersiella caudata TaxID=314043 RepID=A0AA40C2J8_9PEZI|nr:hypothetical protein B0T14DRAFT_514279 [Immersiella caudata]
MRLINIDTMKMEEFFGSQVPRYVILSHTWGRQEISYQDYMWLDNYDQELAEGIIDEFMPRQRQRVIQKANSMRAREGYEKVQRFAAFAQDLRLTGPEHQHTSYIWVDTCCINKESSAELSEAINSMYAWYKKSFRCVAYLSDVESPKADIGQSRWFTRGWTLQELVAPRYVQFHDRNWDLITHRYQAAKKLSKITGINIGIFTGDLLLEYTTIAERISWAAKRETTRVEDQAYCLMGLFDVNMPLLYGEGGNAFQRLQQEIIKSTKDQSIFLWGLDHSLTADWRAERNAMLGRDPNAFSRCGDVQLLAREDSSRLWGGLNYHPYNHTNIGMEMTSLLIDVPFGTAGLFRTFAILPMLSKRFLVGIMLYEPQRRSPRLIEGRALLVRNQWDNAIPLCPPPAVNEGWPANVYVKDVMILSKPLNMPIFVDGPEFDHRFFFHVAIPNDLGYMEAWSSSLVSNILQGTPETGFTIRFTGSCAFQRTSGNPIFLLFRKHGELPNQTADILVVVSVDVQPARINWVRSGRWSVIQEELTDREPPSLAALFLLDPPSAEKDFWEHLPPDHRFFELRTQVQHRISHGQPTDGMASEKDKDFHDRIFLSVGKALDPELLDEYDAEWQDFLLNTGPYAGESNRPLWHGQPPPPPGPDDIDDSPWDSGTD